MTRRHRWGNLLLLPAALMVLGGCASSPPARFYTLTAMEDLEPPFVSVPAGREVVLGIGPIQIPEYLNRAQMVTRSSGNEIHLSEMDLWAGSFKDEITRVLTENMGRRLALDGVYGFPWMTGIAITHRLPVTILKFDGNPGGTVTLRAQWSLLGDGGRKTLIARESTINEPVQGMDYEALAAAQSRALAQLSREMAAAVAREL